MPPKKSGGWGRGRGSNNTSIDITQQGGWGTLLPTPMGGLPLSMGMGGGMPMFGQQPQQLNGFMGAANPHPLFSTMLGAQAGNVDVTMTAAQMQHRALKCTTPPARPPWPALRAKPAAKGE